MVLLRGPWREKAVGLLGFGFEQGVDTSNDALSIVEVNAKINYGRRYAVAMIGPIVVVLIGMIIHFFTMRTVPPDPAYVFLGIDFMGIVDGMYWSVVTCSTSALAGTTALCPLPHDALVPPRFSSVIHGTLCHGLALCGHKQPERCVWAKIYVRTYAGQGFS